jgi:hypothetical protein
VRLLAIGTLLVLMACAQVWGMQDLTLAPDGGGADATDLEADAGSGDAVGEDATEEDDNTPRIDAGDACAPDPRWCDTHCGPGKDNCGNAVSCSTCAPIDAGCSMGTCDSGAQCCTGYCGSAGTCVATCGLATASCTAIAGTACCYGLTCTAGFPPVIRTCQ